ncbi:MAG: GNAT family N-acetyltransferase [Candidatus Electrothrix sp. GM3_4]|nr:GNAT family N-acetyltransferase [Candidatus Electrothrix sp. GM3_4]
MTISIEVLKGIDSIKQIEEEWKALLSAERWFFFSHPGWYRVIWQTYYQRFTVYIILARSHGQLVGILPVCKGRMNKFGLYLPVVEVLGGRRSDYWTPVIKPGYEGVVFPLLLENMNNIKSLSGVIILPNLPEIKLEHKVVNDFVTSNSFSYVTEETSCPWFEFNSTYDEIEKNWSKKHRQDLRRLGNKISRDFGEVSLRVIKDKKEAVAFLPDFFKMHDKAWLARGVPGTFDDKCEQDKFKYIIENLWDDSVHFSQLFFGDKVVAYHFGFVWNESLLLYKPTYDVDFYKYSPGKIHIQYLVKEGLEKKWKIFDFLQGAEQYKFFWAKQEMRTSTYLIKTKFISPSFFWLTRGRPFVQSKIGKIYLKIQTMIQKAKNE